MKLPCIEKKGKVMLIILPVTLDTQKSSFSLLHCFSFLLLAAGPVDFWMLTVLGIGKEAGNGKRQGNVTGEQHIWKYYSVLFAMCVVVRVEAQRH
jgi:hypothetical protein